MSKPDILAFSGSLRKYSTNTGLIRAVTEAASEDMDVEFADISKLPMYNADMDADFPKELTDLKNRRNGPTGILCRQCIAKIRPGRQPHRRKNQRAHSAIAEKL